MAVKLNPYLSFKDNARQAMEFYKSVFGGKLTMNTFKEYGITQDPVEGNKIMHAMLEAGDELTLMGADTPNNLPYRDGANGRISLSGDDEAKLKGYFDKLCQGGEVIMPLEKAQWGNSFGMCTDKFGVNWMVNIAGKPM